MADRSVVTTADAETRVVSPAGLQGLIDASVAEHPSGAPPNLAVWGFYAVGAQKPSCGRHTNSARHHSLPVLLAFCMRALTWATQYLTLPGISPCTAVRCAGQLGMRSTTSALKL